MGDRVTVKGGGASAKLVEDCQRPVGRELDHVLGLLHLNEEGTLSLQDSVGCSETGEDPVDWRESEGLTRNKAANLRHDGGQTVLSEDRRLSTHIWARD